MGILERSLLPKFMIIGAQKCGTSSLFNYLKQHPLLVGSNIKEIDFFSKNTLYLQGVSHYKKYFPQRSIFTSELSFEASVNYMYFPYVAERLYKFNRNLKLIIVLRNPVNRAYSAWNMYRTFYNTRDTTKWYAKKNIIKNYFDGLDEPMRTSGITLLSRKDFPSFQECIDEEFIQIEEGHYYTEPGIISRGLYDRQIENLLKYFSHKQLFFIESNSLLNKTVATLEQILSFLNLSSFSWPEDTFEKQLEGKYESNIERESLDLLEAYYEDHNASLFDLIGLKYLW